MQSPSQQSWIGPAPSVDGTLPGPQAGQWIRRDEAVTSPSNTRDLPLVVKRASGSVIEDLDDNRFLDFAAGIAVCSTGHCHPQVVEAIQTQASKLIHVCGSDFYYEPMVELAEYLSRIMPWSQQASTRVYFTNSGAETIEGAMKLARYHTGRKRLIAFHGAFHGRTMGALSLTASKYKQKLGFAPLVPMVSHVHYGGSAEIRDNLFQRHFPPDEVAAIVVEPIQGEGGYHVPPPEFLPALRELCDEHGILLVMDEIQAGVGRTGRWWACEHDGVIPDIICSAKGLASGMPLGALIARADVMDWPPGSQGSTYGGNPVCCAAALATLKLIESGYMQNAAQLGEVLIERLGDMAANHKHIANPRGRGLMVAFDVVRRGDRPNPGLRDKLVHEAFNRGLILLGCGETAIRVCPPLCINDTQLDVGLKVLDEAMATVGA